MRGVTKPANENSSLVSKTNQTTSDTMSHPRSSTSSRPSLDRASTAVPSVARATQDASATTILSRPSLRRSSTTTEVHRPQVQRSENNRPGSPFLAPLRRATKAIVNTLELTPESSYTHRNKPATPTYWTDYAHRRALLRIWDGTHEVKTSKYGTNIAAQLISTEKEMLEVFGELKEGELPLTREWVVYVLGVCMRPPFCTSKGMGRREILGSSAGPRGKWGPF